MINREMVKVALLTFDSTLDEFGQPNKNGNTERAIKITKPRIYNHSDVEDIRYTDVTDSSLTFEKGITDSNKISIGEGTDKKVYSIKFINSEGRMTQLFLKREK